MAAGLLLCIAWYYTILAGFYVLYCPVFYVLFFNHNWYRRLVDTLFAIWELFPVALFQCCCNTELHHYGDYVNPDEKTIIIMNHRTRVDWNYVWIALYHASKDPSKTEVCICKEISSAREKNNLLDVIGGGRSKIKFVLKDELKVVPGMGWIMQLNFFLYVKRNWQEDQLNLTQFVDYYKRLNYDYRIVLFPEGTDLSDENKRRSEKYAIANNLPRYSYVLHPRTTGWAALCSQLRSAGLASVYDVAIAYDAPAQTEGDLLRGRLPKNIYFNIKRYPIQQIPQEEDDLRKWLNERWSDKEIILRKFHSEGVFIDPVTRKYPIERVPRSMSVAMVAFVFWTIVDFIFTYSLLYSILFQFWVIYHTLLFIFVTRYFGGFQNIQYQLLNKFKL